MSGSVPTRAGVEWPVNALKAASMLSRAACSRARSGDCVRTRCACWSRLTSPATASLVTCSGTSRGTETAGAGWTVAA
eukprot:11118002-Alexandrium_andersonii.AAC.1